MSMQAWTSCNGHAGSGCQSALSCFRVRAQVAAKSRQQERQQASHTAILSPGSVAQHSKRTLQHKASEQSAARTVLNSSHLPQLSQSDASQCQHVCGKNLPASPYEAAAATLQRFVPAPFASLGSVPLGLAPPRALEKVQEQVQWLHRQYAARGKILLPAEVKHLLQPENVMSINDLVLQEECCRYLLRQAQLEAALAHHPPDSPHIKELREQYNDSAMVLLSAAGELEAAKRGLQQARQAKLQMNPWYLDDLTIDEELSDEDLDGLYTSNADDDFPSGADDDFPSDTKSEDR